MRTALIVLAAAVASTLGVGGLGCKRDSTSSVSAAATSASAASPSASASASAARQHAAVDKLRAAIDEHYSYRDRLGLDWASIISGARTELEAATSPVTFAKVAAKMLSAAKDVNIWVDIDGGSRVPTTPSPSPNWQREGMKAAVPGVYFFQRCLWVGNVSKDVGYIMIPSFSVDLCLEFTRAVELALAALADSKRIIIDVRANAGSDENLARIAAGHFVDAPVVYATHQIRDPKEPTGFSKVVQRSVSPVAARVKKPVIVLMGGANAGAGEAFLLMMRAAGAKLMGERSLGASGNSQPYRLGNGVTVHLPSWRAMTADGAPLEGVGIAPDIEVKATPLDLAKGDPLIAAAAKELAK